MCAGRGDVAARRLFRVKDDPTFGAQMSTARLPPRETRRAAIRSAAAVMATSSAVCPSGHDVRIRAMVEEKPDELQPAGLVPRMFAIDVLNLRPRRPV